jgi:DNA-binding MarR family transcriptional regulator
MELKTRSAAHEAQRLFFQIGMEQRAKVGTQLAELESRGLVERGSAEGDRRVKALTLTNDGVALREQVLAVMNEPPDAIASLSAADQRALRDILARAVERLQRVS